MKRYSKYILNIAFILVILISSALFLEKAGLYEDSVIAAKKSFKSDPVMLLARLINGEARGEKYLGQVAVGAVVMNRVKSSKYPNTIVGVIYQKGQFTAVRDGQINKPIKKNSTVYKAARAAVNGVDPTNGALFYYNPRTARSKWIFSRKVLKKIGSHNFCK